MHGRFWNSVLEKTAKQIIIWSFKTALLDGKTYPCKIQDFTVICQSQLHWGRGLLSTRYFTSGRTLAITRPVQLSLKSFRPLVRSGASLVHHTWILVLKPAPSLISDLSWLLSSLCRSMLIYAISQLATEIEEVSPTQPSAWVNRLEVRCAGASRVRESVSMQLMRGINQKHGHL